MQFHTQKHAPAQKKDAPTAASILDTSSQSESLQRKADMANNATQRAEAPRPNNTGMPDVLKAGIESLSGFSMDDVRVHYNSSKPATVQALAYTQGTDIHVAPGQEKCLPHEAWHVAQQMAGRVSPTTNINGMPVNDNAALEHEADVMGERASQKNVNSLTGDASRNHASQKKYESHAIVTQQVSIFIGDKKILPENECSQSSQEPEDFYNLYEERKKELKDMIDGLVTGGNKRFISDVNGCFSPTLCILALKNTMNFYREKLHIEKDKYDKIVKLCDNIREMDYDVVKSADTVEFFKVTISGVLDRIKDEFYVQQILNSEISPGKNWADLCIVPGSDSAFANGEIINNKLRVNISLNEYESSRIQTSTGEYKPTQLDSIVLHELGHAYQHYLRIKFQEEEKYSELKDFPLLRNCLLQIKSDDISDPEFKRLVDLLENIYKKEESADIAKKLYQKDKNQIIDISKQLKIIGLGSHQSGNSEEEYLKNICDDGDNIFMNEIPYNEKKKYAIRKQYYGMILVENGVRKLSADRVKDIELLILLLKKLNDKISKKVDSHFDFGISRLVDLSEDVSEDDLIETIRKDFYKVINSFDHPQLKDEKDSLIADADLIVKFLGIYSANSEKKEIKTSPLQKAWNELVCTTRSILRDAHLIKLRNTVLENLPPGLGRGLELRKK